MDGMASPSYLPAMPATTLSDRAVLRLSGDDPRGFLQGLVTNDVSGPLPVWAGLLSAQGKALFDFLVWADGDDLLVDCEASQADALARRLGLYRLRRRIGIGRDPALAVHWARDGQEGVADPRLPALGRRWLAAPSDTAEGWLAHRLALGVTEGVAELGQDRTLWLEANAPELGGVSFTKGCYVGQENTARMNWRQKVNRRLVVARAELDPGEAARAWYPGPGLAVRHLRLDAIRADPAVLRPDWLNAALAEGTTDPD
jgi:hypothetical protein